MAWLSTRSLSIQRGKSAMCAQTPQDRDAKAVKLDLQKATEKSQFLTCP